MLGWAGAAGDNKRVLGANVAGRKTRRSWPVLNRGLTRRPCGAAPNTACSPAAEGSALLHPAEAGRTVVFIYRLASPYVAIEALVEAESGKGGR